MAYSLSKNIQIFPVTQRNIWDPLGRLTTEYNLTSILNKLLDVDGFVFTPNNFSGGKKVPIVTSKTGEDSTLDFNLYGYVIHIESLQSLLKSLGYESDIYAHILIAYENGSASNKYEGEHFAHLIGKDTQDGTTTGGGEVGAAADKNEAANVYRGIIFSTTKDSPYSDSLSYRVPKHLKILEYKQVSDITDPTNAKYNLEHLKNSNEYSSSGLYIPKESQIKFQSNLKRTSISIDDGVI